ncbi:hypothetical protein AHAT_23100 [Agarivorans sp. Toyoura001]|uniref:competence protein CoiA family protein n=1 Tax=Agarivorans sp. Toyoura001 TaxID=2283141 RepID=UPI0010D50C5E|nr:hypothetical protein [Agarivorans sp. Toyoura001]GDY26420.1 hypothetical protein AHAT_23100 [Agarivorans sp. Toyoura001]
MMNPVELTNDSLKTAFGEKGGQIVHIRDVERGLDCNCVCPGCGSTLIAKKGEVNIHHFAHYDSNGENCNESILHKLSKQIIQNNRYVVAPEIELSCQGTDLAGRAHQRAFTDNAYKLLFKEVIVEQACGDFRPDLTCIAEREKVHIEVVVTNDISPEKLEKVVESGISMIVIDMSGHNSMEDMDTLEKAVLYEAPRRWAYHPAHSEIKEQLSRELEEEIASANLRLKTAVIEHYQLTEQSSSTPATPLLSPTPHQVLLLGYSSAYGYSRKKGRDFDISLLKVGKVISGSCSSNYTVRSRSGYEVDTMVFDESLIPTLETMLFPCVAELEVKAAFRNGRPQIIVAGIKSKYSAS